MTEPHGAIDRAAALVVRLRWLLLVLAAFVTGAGIAPALQLDFDAQLETLFGRDDPLLKHYLESVRTFGGDEVIVVAYTDPNLLTPAGLERVERLTTALWEADKRLVATGLARDHAIRSITDLASSPRPANPLSTRPLLAQLRELSKPPTRDELLAELAASELHRDVLVSRDGRTTALIVTLVPDVGKGRQRRTPSVIEIERTVRETVGAWGFEAHIAGGPVLIKQAVEYLESDGDMFLVVTTGLLTAVIAFFFRSLRWVLIPMAVVHITLVWTKAILFWSGVQLTMISSILTSMVTVIGIATVIHATVQFREERAAHPPETALRRMLAVIGPPTFWTSATTAAGFGALMICEIAPVRTFGLMMCLGSMLVWVVGACVLPGLILLPGLGADPRRAPGEDTLGRSLEGMLAQVERRPGLVGSIGLGLLGALLVGWMWLRVETDFTRNFRSGSPIARASRFIEEQLSGSGVLEVNFTVPARLDDAEVARLRQLEGDLRAALRDVLHQKAGIEPKVLGVVDMLDFLDSSGRGTQSGIGRLFGSGVARLPLPMRLALLRQTGKLDPFWKPPDAAAGRPTSQMRVMLRAPERANSDEKAAVIRVATDVARRVLGETCQVDGKPVPRDIRVTGYYVLLHHLVGRLLYDQRNTFALASAFCLVMLIMCFRDWRLGLMAMVPNAIPIVMVVGAMGWLGLPVNMATAMLSSISIGMAVDSSIHYLLHFQRARRAGLDFDAALARTHQTIGRALVFANVAIVVGFTALVVSHFIPTVHFGILVSIALLGGLVGNLFTLPLLMRLPLLRLRRREI